MTPHTHQMVWTTAGGSQDRWRGRQVAAWPHPPCCCTSEPQAPLPCCLYLRLKFSINFPSTLCSIFASGTFTRHSYPRHQSHYGIHDSLFFFFYHTTQHGFLHTTDKTMSLALLSFLITVLNSPKKLQLYSLSRHKLYCITSVI